MTEPPKKRVWKLSVESQDRHLLKTLEAHPEGHECRMCRSVRWWLAEKAKERWWEKVA